MGDTEDLQRMIDESGRRDRILLEPRVYRLTPAGPRATWCLRIPPGKRLELVGAGCSRTKLLQASGAPKNCRTVHVEAVGVKIADLALDSEPQEDTDEHRAHVFVAAPQFSAERVIADGSTGDGFYLYTMAEHATFTDCIAVRNGRNGLTVGAENFGLRILNGRYADNRAQQIDLEPPRDQKVRRLLIAGAIIDSGRSQDYALTLGGSHPAGMGEDIDVVDTYINGAVNVVWGKNVRLQRCHIATLNDKPGVSVWRQCDRVTLDDCDIHAERGTGVYVAATSGEAAPSNVLIVDTRVDSGNPRATGIVLSGAHSARVERCEIFGMPGEAVTDAYPAGISVRATSLDRPARSIEIVDNEIWGWGRCGVTVGGNTVRADDGSKRSAHIEHVTLTGNKVGLDGVGAGMTDGFILDDGSSVIGRLVIGDNEFGAGVVRHVQRLPVGGVFSLSSRLTT